jgi:hypothetical protein
MHVLVNYNQPMGLLRNVKCQDMHLSFSPPSQKHASHLSMDVMCKHENMNKVLQKGMNLSPPRSQAKTLTM